MAEAGPDRTLDAFHRGAFWLVQPSETGHRAGMDAMMLAAAVPSGFVGRLADLGAGAGAAGLAVAARCPGAQVVLVENAPEMLSFAEKTVAHPANAHLRRRISVVAADAALSGKARAAAGLPDGAGHSALPPDAALPAGRRRAAGGRAAPALAPASARDRHPDGRRRPAASSPLRR